MAQSQIFDLLDQVAPGFREGDADQALAQLSAELNDLRDMVAPEIWRNEAPQWARRHDLFPVLMEDPYARRAREKPRGYAGDAVMLDFIYGEPPDDLSPRALRILEATTRSPNGQSILWRRDLIAREIDSVAESRPAARVLAVACGHLREAEVSQAIRDGAVAELVALDQDPEAIRIVASEQESGPVSPVNASVRDLLASPDDLGSFDLVYAAGLYDYLTDRMAAALTRALCRLLRPGGRVLIGNFTPGNRGRGYMEVVMDWHLHCRSAQDMAGLAETVDAPAEPVFTDPLSNVAYLRLVAP